MDYLLPLLISLVITGGYFYYRQWIQLPRDREQSVLASLPPAPSKEVSDFKGDSDQYMNYLMEHGLSPSEITTKSSLPTLHTYEAIRHLVEEERIEILFLKESTKVNYFDIGQGKVAMAPLVFRKGLPRHFTPDKQEMLALLDLEFKKTSK